MADNVTARDETHLRPGKQARSAREVLRHGDVDGDDRPGRDRCPTGRPRTSARSCGAAAWRASACSTRIRPRRDRPRSRAREFPRRCALCPAENGSKVPGKNATGCGASKRSSPCSTGVHDEAIQMIQHGRTVEECQLPRHGSASRVRSFLFTRVKQSRAGRAAGVICDDIVAQDAQRFWWMGAW